MKRLLTTSTLVAALLVSGCTDENAARKALAQQGYTQIQITGYEPWGCSQDDTFSTGFIAVSAAGVKVEGVVCSDWLKGATIRTF